MATRECLSSPAQPHDEQFELFVANAGAPIPEETLKNLFRPFFRGKANQNGLGLGLYIAAEIARAHDGTLEAKSDEGETRFTFRMPLKPTSAAAS